MKILRICLALFLAAVPLAAQEPNTLSPQEVEEGWILLFDGRTFFGWEFHGDANWSSRGVLRAASGGGGWLGTSTMFADYHLKLEFRTAADGNSGVFLRSARRGNAAPQNSGYELQIYDNQPRGYNTGSLVDYAKAQPAKLIPDEWNQYDIRVEGTHFVISLNGKVVFDGDNPTHRVGVIGLQYNRDRPVEFRNIKLRPLGLEPIFNGKDLSGWNKVDRPQRPAEHNWSVRDGMLHVEKGPGGLETEAEFNNFVMQIAVRTNPPSADVHPNSGVFFRGNKGTMSSGYEAQIRNEFQHGDPRLPVDYGTGAVYNRQPAREIVARDGEFFYKTIAAYGRHISVWVNGIQVTDWTDPRPAGNNARLQARLTPGIMSLQAHDPTTNIDFKNIRVVELPTR
jgi:hypothetical protein